MNACSKKYRHSLWKDRKDYQVRWREIEEVKRVGDVMEDLYKPKKGIKQRMRWSSEAKRYVFVICMWLSCTVPSYMICVCLAL